MPPASDRERSRHVALGVAIVVIIGVVILAGVPWLVRFINMIEPLYDQYAKWACGC